ncbi:hypothetical protein UFOVP891_33 [uncultured Caudovirales phage]|uniref:Uncharacterized protein n=1 Tax=uncultured Caudovirales phage TaxID=2100421 RepID=A0A6J5QMH2_9CAUD|nr:hypothetical protein UFOVP472_34 [uncultured Caudovirales phage]CAB4169101.1 hypothetical protein UFOVP891_33 [uncultured Caudovirales phage]CAB4180774.1 hypothetical protein UFOVP1053_34 [uncultured Caudovirales phage]CAB4195836.1 hypothetical protein UFOVP1297_39 [uncultured Caudovirales phage]CAB4221881.1 hypothetical protein UFOVP1647_17 [uncultured Caudovirales phage]
MTNYRSVEDSAPFIGKDRRSGQLVTRDEFSQYADAAQKQRDSINARLDEGDVKINKISTALFATDENNCNGQAGLMVTARNIDNHIKTVCKIGHWAVKSIIGGCGLIAAVVAAAHALGIY